MEELKGYLDRPEGGSICVLTPFRGLLRSLHRAMDDVGFTAWCGERSITPHWSDQEERENETGQEDQEEERDREEAFWVSTVHKAQGQEFDIVYLLPVEDGIWEWPWSQGKRLVNVAVSRAKRELRIIVSSSLMTDGTEDKDEEGKPVKGIQEELLEAGYLRGGVVPHPKSEDPEVSKKREPQELYIQKLVTYVRDTHLNPPTGNGHISDCKPVVGYPESEPGYPFGFHKTRLASVFDRAAYIKSTGLKGEKDELTMLAPEQCLWEALVELNSHRVSRGEQPLRIYAEVPLRDMMTEQELDKLTGKKRNYCEKARADFVVCDDQDRVLLVVEVDGEQHSHHRYWWNAVRKQAERGFSPGSPPEYINRFVLWVEQEKPEIDSQQVLAELLKLKKPKKKKGGKRPDPWDKFPYKDLLDLWARKQRDDYADNDALKNELFEKDLHAAVYAKGNRKKHYRKEVEEESAFTFFRGAFAFLRLPTDGSTCLEVEALRCVEDLPQDPALGRLWEEHFTLEDLIEHQLKNPCPSKDRTYQPESLTVACGERKVQALVQKALKEKGYLTEKVGMVLDKIPDSVDGGKIWPTAKGKKRGITLACRAARGSLVIYPVYSRTAAEGIICPMIEKLDEQTNC